MAVEFAKNGHTREISRDGFRIVARTDRPVQVKQEIERPVWLVDNAIKADRNQAIRDAFYPAVDHLNEIKNEDLFAKLVTSQPGEVQDMLIARALERVVANVRGRTSHETLVVRSTAEGKMVIDPIIRRQEAAMLGDGINAQVVSQYMDLISSMTRLLAPLVNS